MKVRSLDVAFTRCDELERSLLEASSVRLAVPASLVVVLALGVGAMTASGVARTAAEWTWFVGFFAAYGLLTIGAELRWRQRARDLGHELDELRRWVDGKAPAGTTGRLEHGAHGSPDECGQTHRDRAPQRDAGGAAQHSRPAGPRRHAAEQRERHQ